MSIPAPSTLLPARNPVRAPESKYEVRDTAIKLVGTAGATLGPYIFAAITRATSQFLRLYVGMYGGEDALIPDGHFSYADPRSRAEIDPRNANNHQLTWKVAIAAVDALMWVPELEGKYAA